MLKTAWQFTVRVARQSYYIGVVEMVEVVEVVEVECACGSDVLLWAIQGSLR